MIRETIISTMRMKKIKASHLCKELNIDKGNFSKFSNGKYFLKEEALEKVLSYLNLELTNKD